MGELRILLLGPFQALYDGRSLCPFRTTKEQALLVFLLAEAVTNPGGLHSRETLIELLWSKLPVDAARANLRQTLYQLRRAIPSQEQGDGQHPLELIISTRQAVGLNADYVYSLDVAEFQRQLSLNQLEHAVALYRGDFLENLYVPDSGEFENWAAGQRAELRRLALEALDRLTGQKLVQGRFDQAERYARRQLAIDDLQERAYRGLMEAQARAAKRSSALQQYEICRQRLAEELGIGPSPETERLYEQIVTGDLEAAQQPAIRIMPEGAANWLPLSEPDKQSDAVPIFVERRRELAELGAALESTCAGQGQLRFVVGGAGRGKTALVSEFARRALVSNRELLAVTGYCRDQAGYGDPYAPFREVLARLTGEGMAGRDDAQVVSIQTDRMESAVSWIIPLLLTHAPDLIDSLVPADGLLQRAVAYGGPDSPWIQPLRARPHAPYQENLRQDRLFEQITALLRSIAAKQPLLMVLEDLHLADSTSAALLFHISQKIGDCPLLLVGTYRPEEILPGISGAGKPPLAGILSELKRRHGDIWLDLAKMTDAEGMAFVEKFLDSVPNRLDHAFRRSLFEHTGGHALFTVELVRALQEQGDLVEDEDGRWLAGENIDWSTVPARVEGVIEQRLGRLDGDLQEALTIASVEGETFTAEVVARIQDQHERQLVRRLSREAGNQHRLVKAEALSRSGSQRLSFYRFRHQLFRQYLYQRLDQTELAYLHEEVGRAVAVLYGASAEQEAVRLAWHFEKAGLVEEAVAYLIQAARQATKLGAHEQVIAHASRGLELLDHITQTEQSVQPVLDLQIMLGNAFVATKGFGSAEAGAAFERAHNLCGQAGSTAQIFPVLSGLWGYYIHRADYQLALNLAEQALDLARMQDDSGAIMNARSLVGLTLFYLGEFASSLALMERVIETYDPVSHSSLGLLYGQDPGVCALSIAALALMRLGYPEQALAYSDRAVGLAREIAYPFVLACTLLLALWLHGSRYDMQAVLAIVDEQIALTSEHGFPLQLAIAQFDKYWAQGMSGEAASAIPVLEQALSDWVATGAEVGKSVLLGGLAEVCLRAGRIEEGLGFVEAGIEHCKASGEACYTADLYRIRGKLLWRQGSAARAAEADFARSIDLSRQQNARLLALRATIDQCRLWQQQGKHLEALQSLAECYNWFSEGLDEPALREARNLLETLIERSARQRDGPLQEEGQAAAHDSGLPHS